MSIPVAVEIDEDFGDDVAAAALEMARRFAAGGTMWCVSPQWPSHARHVAVEFVHPVIVGKRALPAVQVDGPDIVDTLRLLVRAGDILVAIGSRDDNLTRRLLLRAVAWGVTRFWLGGGPRPDAGMAEHVVWLEGTDPAMSARSGDVVMLYHLLWELTHVAFEHPGLLEADPTRTWAGPNDGCLTCSDDAQIAEVIELHRDGTASVRTRGFTATVDLSLVDPVGPGALVLVHAGVALTTLGEDVDDC